MPFEFFPAATQHVKACPHCLKTKSRAEAEIATSHLTDLAYLGSKTRTSDPASSNRLAEIQTHYPQFQLYFPRLNNLHENDLGYNQQPNTLTCRLFIKSAGASLTTQDILSFASVSGFHHYVCICAPGGKGISLWCTTGLVETMAVQSRGRVSSFLKGVMGSESRTASASVNVPDDLLFFFFNLQPQSVAQPGAGVEPSGTDVSYPPLSFDDPLQQSLAEVTLRRRAAAGAVATTHAGPYDYDPTRYASDSEEELPAPPTARAPSPSSTALRNSALFQTNEYAVVVAGPQCPYCPAPVMHSFLQTPGKKVYQDAPVLDARLVAHAEFSEMIKKPCIKPRTAINAEMLRNIIVYDIPGPLPLAEFSNRIHVCYAEFANNDILVGIKPDGTLDWMHTRCFQTTHHKEAVVYSGIDLAGSDMLPLPPLPGAPITRVPSPPPATAAEGIVYAALDFAPTGYVKIVRFLSNS